MRQSWYPVSFVQGIVVCACYTTLTNVYVQVLGGRIIHALMHVLTMELAFFLLSYNSVNLISTARDITIDLPFPASPLQRG